MNCPTKGHTVLSLILLESDMSRLIQKAIKIEPLALDENQTWDIVPCPPSIKSLSSKFVLSIKLRLDGSFDRYKARLVVLGNKQEYGLDYDGLMVEYTTWNSLRC
ncbi:putative mitochondrial protein, partial [Mucuna pruriens]